MELNLKKQSNIYLNGNYLKHNPTWHREDAAWKASHIAKILKDHDIKPQSICEIGCGSGEILSELRKVYEKTELTGFDISSDAAVFWEKHVGKNIQFINGDFLTLSNEAYDVILLLDVLEHMIDPFTFLSSLHNKAKFFLVHFPLDLSAFSIMYDKKLLDVHERLGHIHYYTRNLALGLLKKCDYCIISDFYTGAAFSSPERTWKTYLASIPRFIAYALNKDFGVRLLGGETLFVLCKYVSQTK